MGRYVIVALHGCWLRTASPIPRFFLPLLGEACCRSPCRTLRVSGGSQRGRTAARPLLLCPSPPRPSCQNNLIVVAGLNHLSFYSLVGTNLVRRPPIVGTKGRVGKMMCIGWVGHTECVVGTGSGKLYKFRDNVLQQVGCGGCRLLVAGCLLGTVLLLLSGYCAARCRTIAWREGGEWDACVPCFPRLRGPVPTPLSGSS
jgi:hypothetical protein